MGSKSLKSIFSSELLAGKVALVTGSGKGIGKACSEQLVAAGATVYAVARTQSDLDALEQQLGDQLIGVCQDAASDEFLSFIDSLDRLDILVNNVGTNTPQPFVEVEDDVLDRMLSLNVRSLFKVGQHAVRKMQSLNNGGSIINISSQMGHVGSPGRTVYCMTKHAIEGLTKAMGVELAPDNIRVNSVAPTFIETPMTAPMFDKPEFKKFVDERIPLGRVGQPNDVANAVVFLASDAAQLVTGSCYKVDGGWTAQ